MAAALFGAAAAIAGNAYLTNKVLLDVAVALGIAAGMLAGVLVKQHERQRRSGRAADADAEPAGDDRSAAVATAAAAVDPTPVDPAPLSGPPDLDVTDPLSDLLGADMPPADPAHATTAEAGASSDTTPDAAPAPGARPSVPFNLIPVTALQVQDNLERWVKRAGPSGVIAVATAAVALFAIVRILTRISYVLLPSPRALGIGVGACLIFAALAATTARYLANIDPAALVEAPGLARGARVMAWLLATAAAALGMEWAGQFTAVRAIHLVVVAILVATSYDLFKAGARAHEAPNQFPVDLGPVSMLGSRPNLLASVLDSAERQLGIDLRSTWAFTVVRRSLEPLAVGLVFLGWLSTSLTVVGVQEQGLVERLGVPVPGDPLTAGLHAHWPWPVDKVFRIPVQRVEAIEVGHEGSEAAGPENVLWAVEHAANEYTLLLGNGRDLITVDAAVQYRIVDAKAWRYHSQNPALALSALAYRAVMRNTVNRTLSEALSENVATLTAHMRQTVQSGADSLGLGVAVVGFTIGGMHPPVAVAPSYQSVIAAEIRKVTAVVNAQAFRNQTIPSAEATSLVGLNNAHAEGAESLARAAGEAWSFRTLNSQYHAAPEEFLFRRRLETLEAGLATRPFTVVDARFLRDGGELWIVP